jgi:hypothetical protein
VRYLVEEHGVSVEGGPDCGSPLRETQSLSPLGVACIGGHLHIVRYLLERCGAGAENWEAIAVYGRVCDL